ncbi:MAG: NAD-dependent epimerase/dehydratase family protein, partial [Cyclobacteriaceae bacterium]|nr:NAD-dependent epimerase/dehydratase family protein [Cyclobacteriaceae bacterium]
MNNILVIGCNGQLGTELIAFLRDLYGREKVIGADIRKPDSTREGIFETVNALDFNQLKDCVQKHQVKEVYHLAAILSVNAEKNPLGSWDLNMKTLLNVLELGRQGIITKIFWPGSIAAFGPSTPKENTPQNTLMDPNTSYGISKLAGERWCDYYFQHYGVDVRSLRYPGIISYKTGPGGGTTDYAIDIFFQALKTGEYECFLHEDTRLPMMYIDDAV